MSRKVIAAHDVAQWATRQLHGAAGEDWRLSSAEERRVGDPLLRQVISEARARKDVGSDKDLYVEEADLVVHERIGRATERIRDRDGNLKRERLAEVTDAEVRQFLVVNWDRFLDE